MQLALFDNIEVGIDFLENRTDEELFNLGAASKIGTNILINRGYQLEEIEHQYAVRSNAFVISYERGKDLIIDRQNGGAETAKSISERDHVPIRTVERDVSFAKSVDIIADGDEDTKIEILSQSTGMTKRDVIESARAQDGKFHISSKQNDWYTPPKYIESARTVLGSIDVDPASSELAQQTVKAETYYTEETNGLNKIWNGKVWMNPPYSMPEIQQFIDKLLNSDVTEWIVLTNNSSDTGWFHKLMTAADMVCFTKGRVGFENIDGDIMATRQGQTFFYKGNNNTAFVLEFVKYGAILEVMHEHEMEL